jgi:HPt (histidine-containing phosphotransfer) domain-containing protein
MTQQSTGVANNLPSQETECQLHWTLPDVLVDLADGSPGLIADLIEAFRTDIQPRLTQVRRALVASNRKGIRAEIHNIKGSSQQMGADAMAYICLEIELTVGELPAVQLGERLQELETEFDEVCRAMDAYSSTQLPHGSMADECR